VGFEKDVAALRRISEHLSAEVVLYTDGVWSTLVSYDCIVAYMPSGIVVRGMCPHLRSKWTDAAVVVVDKPMRYAIPILGGHHGANDVAHMLEGLGMTPVITTAMEYEEGLSIGVGCRRGIGAQEVLDALLSALAELDASPKDIRVIATAQLKKDEKGLIEAADTLKKPLMFASAEELNSISVPSGSRANIVGLNSVAEACSLLYSKHGELLLPKRVYGGVTVAISR